MKHYNYDPHTGILLGSEESIESPLEPGVYLLPAHATFKTPPGEQAGKVIVFIEDDWQLHNIPQPPAPEPPPLPTWADVRAKRDDLLRASDFSQLPDAPVDHAAWAVYRQELRDITKTFSNPADVIWPTAP